MTLLLVITIVSCYSLRNHDTDFIHGLHDKRVTFIIFLTEKNYSFVQSKREKDQR